MGLNSNPIFPSIVYYWTAVLKDGTIVQQYDPDTGEENSFVDNVKDKPLLAFTLQPFSQEFGQFLIGKGRNEVYPIFSLPSYTLNLKEGQRLIFYRRTTITGKSYRICPDCRMNFEWKDPSTLCKCPQCGLQNYYGCEPCGVLFEDLKEKKCPKCGGELTYIPLIEQHGTEERKIVYLLGFQETIDGKNYQTVLFIDENGCCEVKSKVGKGGEWS